MLILVILTGVGIYALTSYINKSNKKINELENQIIEVKKSNDLENNENLNNSREEVNIINETSNTTKNQILNTSDKTTSSEITNETNKTKLSEEEALKMGKEKYNEVLTVLDSIEIIEAENLGEPNGINNESLNKARSLFTNNGFSDFIKSIGIYEKDGEYYEDEMGDNPSKIHVKIDITKKILYNVKQILEKLK